MFKKKPRRNEVKRGKNSTLKETCGKVFQV